MSLVDDWKKRTDHWTNNDIGIQKGKTKALTQKPIPVPSNIPHGQNWDQNLDVCGNRLATNCLSHGTAMMSCRHQHLAWHKIKTAFLSYSNLNYSHMECDTMQLDGKLHLYVSNEAAASTFYPGDRNAVHTPWLPTKLHSTTFEKEILLKYMGFLGHYKL